jgi:hypothetical protein
MSGRIPTRPVSVAVIAALAPWCFGCATEILLQRSGVEAGGMGKGWFQVRVFDSPSGRRRDLGTRLRVVSELYRLEGANQTLVRREEKPRWTASDLQPGTYALRVERWIDDRGSVQALPFKYRGTFDIHANETAMADVILADAHHGWLKFAAGAAVAVGGVYLLGRREMERWRPLGGAWTH